MKQTLLKYPAATGLLVAALAFAQSASAQSSLSATNTVDANYVHGTDWAASSWTGGVPDAEGAVATINMSQTTTALTVNSRTATFGIGASPVTLGSLSLSSTESTTGTNTLAIRVGTTGQNITFNGAGSGNATLNTVGSPSGTQNGIIATVTLDSNLDITGISSIMFGSAIVGNGHTITKSNSGAANFNGFSGNVTLNAGSASGTTALGGAGAGLTLNLTGNILVNFTGGSLAGINSTVTSQFNGNSANRALTLAGAGTYSTVATIGANTSTITKSGSGTQAFTGNVSNTSTVSITNGTLIIDGALTNVAAATTVTSTLTNTAILAGHGTVQAITLSGGAEFGGVLDVRNSVDSALGDLNATSLLWNGTTDLAFSQMKFDLSGNSAASDQLLLSGAMTKGTGSIFQFDFGGTGDISVSRTYTLVTAAGGFGTFGAGDFSYTGLANGLTGVFGISGNDLQFTTTAVPEPSAFAALAGLGALGFVASRRRRRA